MAVSATRIRVPGALGTAAKEGGTTATAGGSGPSPAGPGSSRRAAPAPLIASRIAASTRAGPAWSISIDPSAGVPVGAPTPLCSTIITGTDPDCALALIVLAMSGSAPGRAG